MAPALDRVVPVLEVILINVVLSGDNALVIALMARQLPERERVRALAWGIGLAALTAAALLAVVARLVTVPGLRLVGAVLLAGIACKLLRAEARADGGRAVGSGLPGAILRIAAAQLVLSLDNVLALAGTLGRADPIPLAIGLAASVALLLGAGVLIAAVMERVRWVAYAGAAVLAWTAAGMLGQDLAAIGPPATPAADWGLHAALVAACLTSPRWWPGLHPGPTGPPEEIAVDRPHRATTEQAGTRRDCRAGLSPRRREALRRLPRDVGVALTALGIAGLIIPGPVPPGIPLLTAGVVFLWPGLLDRVGGRFGCRFPAAYRRTLSAIDRFRADLERRYPDSVA